MGKNFRETLNEQMQNPEFRKEWDALEPEFQIIKAILDARKEKNITHAVLGITQIFRFWSCYDALVDRTGGVWHNRI